MDPDWEEADEDAFEGPDGITDDEGDLEIDLEALRNAVNGDAVQSSKSTLLDHMYLITPQRFVCHCFSLEITRPDWAVVST
jgi:hypothetical protein